MKLYIFLDPLYHETLLETIEQMVQLKEKNYIILGHFQVIIELIESKFPHI